VAGGAPRFSLPINDGAFNPDTDYAFIDAAGCGAVNGDNPNNDATLVSTQNPACHVNFHGTDYANWATFASANPTYKMALGYVPFIIADGTAGTYVVTDIVLRESLRTIGNTVGSLRRPSLASGDEDLFDSLRGHRGGTLRAA
jgi:hypothetical protein